MPSSTSSRPPTSALLRLLVGAVLAILGAAVAVAVGPEGRISASLSSSTGVVVIEPEALVASRTTPGLSAAASTGAEVTLVPLLEQDADALTDGVRHAQVTGVSMVARALTATEQGEDRLPDELNPDLFLRTPATGERVEEGVPQGGTVQALLIFAGRPGAVREAPVTVTLTWADAAWFWEAIAVAALGLALAAWGSASWWGRRPGHSRPAREPAVVAEPRP